MYIYIYIGAHGDYEEGGVGSLNTVKRLLRLGAHVNAQTGKLNPQLTNSTL